MQNVVSFLRLGLLIIALAGLAALNPVSAEDAPGGRVVILGFDGVEPSIVDEMMAKGELPNLAALREKGGYDRLATTLPPQSPVAWASFATSLQPGKHGVFDFMARDPRQMTTRPGFGITKTMKFSPDGSVYAPAQFETNRRGKTFWTAADEQGVRAKVLYVPFMTPPDPMEHGKEICGLGVTDIRRSSSFSFSLSDRYPVKELAPGGVLIPLQFDGDKADARIPGHPAVVASGYSGSTLSQRVEMPLRIEVNRKKGTVKAHAAGRKFTLKEGEWSEWFESEHKVTGSFTVHAVSRFHLIEAGSHVNLYMTSLQSHPEHPYIPFTSPESYSTELAKRYGLFKTVGWAYDTHALRMSRLTEDAFLEDIRTSMAWRERLTLDEIDAGNFELLISVWTATDRVAHMFWRFRDKEHLLYTSAGAQEYGRAVEDTYRKMDEIVGKTMERLGGNDLLLVLSDHGFSTYHYGFSVNTWLVRNGYAWVKGQRNAANAYGTRGGYLRDFDWLRTRAYAMGLSSLYLNVRGRERTGIVPRTRVEPLRLEIREKLLEVVCPRTGEKIFKSISVRGEYEGEAVDKAADLVLEYNPSYQASKPTYNGGIPPDVFIPCRDKWSGEHAASAPEDVPGILFSSRPLSNDDPDIRDLSVTALRFLGKTVPEAFEGKPLF